MSTCSIRAVCVRATAPAATAGRSPVKTLFALTPLLLLVVSLATAAIAPGPEDDIENDADRLDNERPPRELTPILPPPLLPPPSVTSVIGCGKEGAEAASEAINAGGERRYSRGANAPDSSNALRQT